MTEERENELIKKFFVSEDTVSEELENIEIQEIIFLIYSARYFKDKGEMLEVNFDEKIKMFFKILQNKIKTAEELYITYDKNTKCPYIDVKDRTWIFSKKEYADNAKDYFLQQLVELEMKKVNKEEIMSMFADFHRLGIKKVLIDNGEYTTEINRDDILAPPDWSSTPKINIPVTNPELQCAMISFFQELNSKNNYDGKAKALHKLEDRMLKNIISSKYLVPMKLKDKEKSTPDENGEITLKKDTIVQFANLVDKDNKPWQPAFTDWSEFEKVYDKSVWGGNVVTYDDLLELSKDMEGIVVNCRGICFRISENNKKTIEKFKEEQNNPKVAPMKKNTAKAGTKVVLGEPKDYPYKMIEAVKEYMKHEKHIKAAYLKLMIKDSEKSYLVLVDFKGDKDEIFKSIANAANPYLNGMFLDMIGMENGLAKEAMKDTKPFYRKKILGII